MPDRDEVVGGIAKEDLVLREVVEEPLPVGYAAPYNKKLGQLSSASLPT